MPELTSTEVTPPGTGVVMSPGYAKTIGRMANVWGWSLLNMINRSASITTAPQPGRLNGVLPVAPRGRVGCYPRSGFPPRRQRRVHRGGL